MQIFLDSYFLIILAVQLVFHIYQVIIIITNINPQFKSNFVLNVTRDKPVTGNTSKLVKIAIKIYRFTEGKIPVFSVKN
jgi:hypothetical protein